MGGPARKNMSRKDAKEDAKTQRLDSSLRFASSWRLCVKLQTYELDR